MKKLIHILVLTLIFLLMLVCVCACTIQKPIIVSTNQYIQTDYNYDCLAGDKTFSEIILCYQKQDKSEKAQNHITNELIEESTSKK